ncbi:Metalloendoproteinase 5-MMP, partial [Mucuna pruriens]
MKTYLYAILLFLLIVDHSLSATARLPYSSVARSFAKMLSKNTKRIKSKWRDDDLKDLSPPTNVPLPPSMQNTPQPYAPPMKINNLSYLKDYFSDFGYLQPSESGPFDDYLDQKTMSALKTYQQYFNLPATGYLNNETIDQISLLRCAVPDMNFNYEFTDNVSWPKARNQWFPTGKNLTYGFLPDSQIPANMTEVLTDAFTRWAEATGVLNLTETIYDDADIKVGFYIFDDGVDDAVLGGSIIRLEPDSNMKTGEIRLDATLYWALPIENDSLSWEDGVLDLESAAMHQIGHLLGLDHSNHTDSVMYPYILPSQQRKVQLSQSDMDNIHQVYSPNGYSAHTGPSGLILFTTFSLGFAYSLLFY